MTTSTDTVRLQRTIAAPPARVYDSRLTVELAETEYGATELTLVHEHLEELRAALPEVADSVAAGWAAVLDALGPRL